MRLGYLTQLTKQECELAARIGYDCLEVHGQWESDQLQGHAAEIADEVRSMLGVHELTLSAIALYRPGAFEVKQRIKLYAAYIDLCAELGVDTITALSGGDPEKSLDENLDAFSGVFEKIAPKAEGEGVQFAFENWPGLTGTFPPMGSVNFAFTPQVWDRMFEAVDSPALGLEFDPSHLVWQGVDWAAALKRFAHRIYHVHAKDTEILKDRLSTDGFFSPGWWRYRLPGYGCVDWHRFTSLLKELGYDGGVCVEHEDPVFSGERRTEGLQKAYAHLKPLM